MPKLPQGGNVEYQNPPAGPHIARLYRVIDLGTQIVEWAGEQKNSYKFMLSWELPNAMMDPTAEFPEPRCFTVHTRYTYSLYQSNLLALLGGMCPTWDLDEMDNKGEVPLEDLLGMPCQLSISNDTDDKGRVWTNVMTAMPLMEGQVCPEAQNAEVWFWMSGSTSEYNADFEAFSKSLQRTIRKSPEYEIWQAARTTSAAADSTIDQAFGEGTGTTAGSVGVPVGEPDAPSPSPSVSPVTDDDIPF